MRSVLSDQSLFESLDQLEFTKHQFPPAASLVLQLWSLGASTQTPMEKIKKKTEKDCLHMISYTLGCRLLVEGA